MGNSHGALEGLFGNISTFGPQYIDYVKAILDDGPQVLMVNETHVPQSAVGKAEASMKKMGFNSYWTPAEATDAGGSAGGTMVAAKDWLPSSHLAAAPGQAGIDPLAMPLPDFTPMVLRLEGFTFLLISLYLTSGPMLRGCNARKLAMLAAWIKLYKLPWLCLADWNVPPWVLQKDPWLKMVEGQIALPSNAGITCSAGSGALLDYAVHSADMKGWLHLLEAIHTPWKPHMALRFKVAAPLKQVDIRVLQMPSTPALPMVSKKCLKQRGQDRPQGEWNWRQCKEVAERNQNQGTSSRCKHAVPYSLQPLEAERLGKMYGRFVTAAEVYHAKGDQYLANHLPKAIGRAYGPRFVVRKAPTAGPKSKVAALASAPT